MRFVPLTPELLRLLLAVLPPATLRFPDDYVAIAAAPGLGVAMLDGGYIIGAGGLIPFWRGRAQAWLLRSRFARPRHFAIASRYATAWLEAMQREPDFRRIECQVMADFAAGLRYVGALGFAQETPRLEAWDIDGRDHIQFKRIAPAAEGCQLAAAD